MKLITCCHDGGLYKLNDNLEYSKIFDGDCRGLDFHDNKIYLINSLELQVLDKNFNKINSIIINYNYHGLKIYNDQIYISNTRYDKIDIYNLNLEYQKSIGFYKLNNTDDNYHINDFCFKNNYIYISMFNRNNGKLIEKHLYDYSKRFNRIIIDNLRKPHSPFLYESQFYICDSENCSVTNKRNFLIQLNGFTRGLYIENNIMWVGVSNSETHKEKVSNRQMSAVYKINMITGENIFVDLPSNEVYGIYHECSSNR
jgi:hypothetical protein